MMRIVIIENERDTASNIENICYSILKNQILSVRTFYTSNCVSSYLLEESVDLCIIDLDADEENSIELLKTVVSGPFHTVVISENSEREKVVLEYGALDFIKKPVNEERMRLVFDRFFQNDEKDREVTARFLTTQNGDVRKIIAVDDIIYFKSAGIYVDAKLKKGGTAVLEKSLEKLDQILPARFRRTHSSFLVDVNQIQKLQNGSRNHKLITRTGEALPISRRMYKKLNQ